MQVLDDEHVGGPLPERGEPLDDAGEGLIEERARVELRRCVFRRIGDPEEGAEERAEAEGQGPGSEVRHEAADRIRSSQPRLPTTCSRSWEMGQSETSVW